mgnify:CR=1 FL=1
MNHVPAFKSYPGEYGMSSRCIVPVFLVVVASCGPAPSDEVLHHTSAVGMSEASQAAAMEQLPLTQDTSNDLLGPLAMPAWMANDLAPSNVHVKLQALDRWAQTAPVGSVDPLIQALEDEDDLVQDKALVLLEEDWRAQEDER